MPRARGAGGASGPGSGPPGVPGGGFPGAEGAPGGGEVVAQPNPANPQAGQADNTAARRAFQAYANSPEVRAYRGFTGCTYITMLSASDAKAKGIVPDNGRPGMYYVPATGLVFVQALQLPQGGGSLKQGK